MIPLILAIGAVALVFALLVAQALIVPLGSLRKAAEKISTGDLDVRLKIPAGDEVGDLADSFERMVSAIKFFREQSRSEEEEIAAEAAFQQAQQAARGESDSDREPEA
jgi:nitrogen fixation/metabolism regulation signal transduction histidine kinase